jgi:hypothetical protein
MLVFRRVATADMPTGQAQPEMQPGVSHAQTLLTALGARAYSFDVFEMRTGHGSLQAMSSGERTTRGCYAEPTLACLLQSVANSTVCN